MLTPYYKPSPPIDIFDMEFNLRRSPCDVSPLMRIDIFLTSSEKLLKQPALRSSCLDNVLPEEFILRNTSSMSSDVDEYSDIANLYLANLVEISLDMTGVFYNRVPLSFSSLVRAVESRSK